MAAAAAAFDTTNRHPYDRRPGPDPVGKKRPFGYLAAASSDPKEIMLVFGGVFSFNFLLIVSFFLRSVRAT